MRNLTITDFRVQNFRNIDDSGWIPLERVTALVGRNESGKSALLKALHKFNPATEEPFNPQKDFPRDRFTRDFKDGADWPGCSVRFEVDNSIWSDLELNSQDMPSTITVTRYYDDSLNFEFEPLPAETVISRGPLDEALQQFRVAVTNLESPAPDQQSTYDSLRTDFLNWCDSCEDRLANHDNLRTNAAASLLDAIRDELNGKTRGETSAAITPLQSAVKSLLQEARRPSIHAQLQEIAEQHLPVFIYFENYGILDSAVFLPRFVEDAKREPHNPRVRTINAMFKHVRLEAEEILQLGQSHAENARHQGQKPTDEQILEDQKRKELRSIKLNSASNDISKRFGEWWKQRRHKIRYSADGDFFRIWVSDDRRPNVDIELEGRSRGFQWFFSFYLVFLVESDDGHQDAVLLLDEPGLNLHPTAKEELIAFFEELSEHNPLIYSTHSPWLIDGQHLERVRPVTEDETGHSRISVGEWPRDRETIFPLQGAAPVYPSPS